MQTETVIDLRYNVAAMYIAILRDDVATPEQAFAVIEGATVNVYDDNDVIDMIRLKEQGMSYEAIGRIYGYTGSGIKNRVYKYRKKTSLAGGPKRSE